MFYDCIVPLVHTLSHITVYDVLFKWSRPEWQRLTLYDETDIGYDTFTYAAFHSAL